MRLQWIKGKRVLCYLCVILIIAILLKDEIWGENVPVISEDLEEDENLTIIGQVKGLETKEFSQYIYLETDTNTWLIYDYEFLDLAIGNTLQVTGELKVFDVARNPGNFNTQAYYYTKGIVAGLKAENIIVLDESTYLIRNYLYELRLKGVEYIYNILGEEQGSLLVAMIFGEKNGMDDEQKELYQKIGISHIFAISGLHISLISLGIYQVLRRLTGSFAVAGIASGILLLLYVILIGFGISAVRASIMFMIRVGADISGRVYDMRTSLAIAAMCILICNPLYLYDGSFLLSFGAILGVIYLVPFWEELFRTLRVRKQKPDQEKHTIRDNLIKGVSASIGIQLMILPVLLYFYYEISPYSILLNILVVPIMSLLLAIALIGIAISLFWYGLGTLLICFSGWLLQVIEFLSQTVLSLYMSRIVVGRPWWWMIVLYYIGIVMVLGYLHIIERIDLEEYKKQKVFRKVGIILFSLIGLMFIPEDILNPTELMITMIDVDQGDSIFITGEGLGTYLIDGGSTGVSEVGKYRIEPYLLSMGVNKVDYVFISHGDTDHLNGIEEMLVRQELGVEIGTVVVCTEQFLDEGLIGLIEIAQENGTQVAMIEAGTTIYDKDLEITCIAPLETYEGELGNESSMILDVSLGNLQVLFTGDVEGEGEEQLIEILATSEEIYPILKVAHHGSSNSTSSEFLELIEPKVALISAGVDSIYGHPHEETLELLESYGCAIYATPTNGGVTLSYNTNGDTIIIEETIVVKD